MSFKTWILHKMNGLTVRTDLPRSPVLLARAGDSPSLGREARHRLPAAADTAAPSAAHLGPYAPLIDAIRDELEHFVLSQLRLHLAIAERDRYRLTSIEVTTSAADASAELLRKFIAEFKPEQIKHYVAKELIGALPNASAIDLSQFAGLNADALEEEAEDDEGYQELLAELESAKPAAAPRPYEVSLVGHWSEVGPATQPSGNAGAQAALLARAGRSVEIAIEDADGARRVTLQSVWPGCRYAIGKGEGCDLVVSGTYASRRHCEVWLDRGAWWVTDIGSTNGVRVEGVASVLGRSSSEANDSHKAAVVEVKPGARIVLSAYASGGPTDYPRLMLDVGRDVAASVTPIAPRAVSPATPSTPIAAARLREGAITITARMASGVRTVELHAGALPFSVGRSRNQALVIDWAHEGVSGHHIDISELDEAGATVVVYGDNGVTVAGAAYAPGARLRWKAGESLALGRAVGHEPECFLTLSRSR
jgi:pSer/pThr/pTyr-binding forkhead associated (FHA) protein